MSQNTWHDSNWVVLYRHKTSQRPQQGSNAKIFWNTQRRAEKLKYKRARRGFKTTSWNISEFKKENREWKTNFTTTETNNHAQRLKDC